MIFELIIKQFIKYVTEKKNIKEIWINTASDDTYRE